MKESSDGFLRANEIDLKSLDDQLERHFNRAWTLEKKREDGTKEERISREEWEIDPTKLVIKTVIGRGTFRTVHRGIYDGHNVAGGLCILMFCLEWVVLGLAFVLRYYAYVQGDLSGSSMKRSAKVQEEEMRSDWPWPFQV